MPGDAFFPLFFDESSPAAEAAEYLHDPSVRLLVEFFRSKGLKALKEEDRQEGWYQDWIDYQAHHGLYASLLSPQRYSSRGHRFDLMKLTHFLEVFAYFSPAHAYSLHVSFLGLFPIMMSANESLKQEAVARLEGGGLLAFAVSERAHGSDLLANEFTLGLWGAGDMRASGSKYYIGNVNGACLISVLARKADAEHTGPTRRSAFAFFALRPGGAPGFRNVRKIRTLGIRQAFVGEFDLQDHAVVEKDIISQGREAWNAVLGTVNLGKFFLGFGAIGICAHAFVEAVAHMRNRILYGKPASSMPHLRMATTIAFARLTAMKLYAYRALDYLQVSSSNDRRYLLFSAVQKARVTKEGVKVIGLLSTSIGARAFEAETYFEMALRDAQLIPALEGSTHINFGLAAQFIPPYFAHADAKAPTPESVPVTGTDAGENPYWFEARDRNAKTVRFPPFLQAYEALRAVPNVRTFMQQVGAFRGFVASGVLDANSTTDLGLFMALGECFAIIAFAQLVAEKCVIVSLAASTVAVIFHTLIEDLSAEVLRMSAMIPVGPARRALLEGAIDVPQTTGADLEDLAEFIAGRYGAG